MAFSINGADFNSLFGVTEIANKGLRGVEALNMLELSGALDTDTLVQHIIDTLKEKIKQLEQSEKDFFDMFDNDCKTPNDFKRKVKEYYNNETTLHKFTGSELKTILNEFRGATRQASQQDAELIRQLLQNAAKQRLDNFYEEKYLPLWSSKEVTQAEVDEVAKVLLEALDPYGKGGKLTSTKFLQIESGIVKIVSSKASKAFWEHVRTGKDSLESYARKQLLSKKTEKLGETYKKNIENAKELYKVNIKVEGNTQSFGVEYWETIANLTKGSGKSTDIQGGNTIDNKKLREANEQITELIIDYLNLPSKYEDFARKRITSMWNSPGGQNMFFTGKSTNQLNGILGEISAAIAITNLLGDKYQDKIFDYVQWSGGINDTTGGSSKLPSVDIVLEQITGRKFGIQVKNTTDDLTDDFKHYITFADKSIEETFKQLGIDEGGVLRNVYIADNYNVPVKRIGNLYQKVDYGTSFEDKTEQAEFSQYVRIDKLIDQIVRDINLFLTLYAPDFLYIGLGDDFRSKLAALNTTTEATGGNFAYIVGREVFFAKDILMQLQEELAALQDLTKMEEQVSFKLEAYIQQLDNEDTPFTIVEAWNNKGHLSKHTIKMRSSWGFHK